MDINATMPGTATYESLPGTLKSVITKEEMYRLMFNSRNDHARWNILIEELPRKAENPPQAKKDARDYHKAHRSRRKPRQNEDLLPLGVTLGDLPSPLEVITEHHTSNEVRWAFLGGSMRPGGSRFSAGRTLRDRVERRLAGVRPPQPPRGLESVDMLTPLPEHLHASFISKWRRFGSTRRDYGWLALNTALFLTFNEHRSTKGDLEVRRVMYVRAADDTREAEAWYRAQTIRFY